MKNTGEAMKRKCLKNGFSIPVLGMGTWCFGGRDTHDPENDDEAQIHALRRGGKIPHQTDASRKAFVQTMRVHRRFISEFPKDYIHIQELAARCIRRVKRVSDLNDFHALRPFSAKSITRHSYFP